MIISTLYVDLSVVSFLGEGSVGVDILPDNYKHTGGSKLEEEKNNEPNQL